METWMLLAIIGGIFFFLMFMIGIVVMARKQSSDITVWNLCTGEDGTFIEEKDGRTSGSVDLVIRPTGLEGMWKSVVWTNVPKTGILDYHNLPGKEGGLKIVISDGSDREAMVYKDLVGKINDCQVIIDNNRMALSAKEHEKKMMIKEPMSHVSVFSGLLDKLEKDKKKRDGFPDRRQM